MFAPFRVTFLPSEKSSNPVAIDRSDTTRNAVSPPQAVDKGRPADNSETH
jgi:hypothetical protein